MNTPNNKRSQETLQKIDEAFATLLQEKSLNEVEVSELCELAEINRSTFYAHYDDVTALKKAFTEKTEKMVQSLPHSENDYSWIFTYIKERPHHFAAYFKLGMQEVEADYKTLFLRSAVHGVAKLWFESGCVEPAEKMGTLIMREMNKRLYNRDRLMLNLLSWNSVLSSGCEENML